MVVVSIASAGAATTGTIVGSAESTAAFAFPPRAGFLAVVGGAGSEAGASGSTTASGALRVRFRAVAGASAGTAIGTGTGASAAMSALLSESAASLAPRLRDRVPVALAGLASTAAADEDAASGFSLKKGQFGLRFLCSALKTPSEFSYLQRVFFFHATLGRPMAPIRRGPDRTRNTIRNRARRSWAGTQSPPAPS